MRYKTIRKELKLKQKDVAEMLGVTNGYICDIERGEKTPSALFVNAFCSIFKVNKGWLETGEGKPFREVTCPYKELFREGI